jgi:hypothetical protein
MDMDGARSKENRNVDEKEHNKRKKSKKKRVPCNNYRNIYPIIDNHLVNHYSRRYFKINPK